MPSSAPTSQLPIVLSGFGPVGQEFFEKIQRNHHRDVYVAGVRGHETETTLAPDAKLPARTHWKPLTPIEDFLKRTGAFILVQALPSSSEARQRAVDESMSALHHGVHVVTATKSHLLTHWRELEEAARIGKSQIRISGATGAALPLADLARIGVHGLGCQSLRACPNGTSTFILDRIAGGESLEEAIREAQRLHIAEADTSADLTGSDSATKSRLIAGLLWGWDVSKIDVETETIDENTARLATASARSGHRLRAVATASVDFPMKVSVRLEPVAPSDPLFHISGPEKAMTFHCPDAGDITVRGGRSSPTGAGLAMVKDTVNLLSADATGFR